MKFRLKNFYYLLCIFKNLLKLNFRTITQNFRNQSSIRASMFELQQEVKYAEDFIQYTQQ